MILQTTNAAFFLSLFILASMWKISRDLSKVLHATDQEHDTTLLKKKQKNIMLEVYKGKVIYTCIAGTYDKNGNNNKKNKASKRIKIDHLKIDFLVIF